MKIFKLLVILVILFTINNSIAQSKKIIKISGFVKDSLNKPIQNCAIFIDNIKQKKKTNRKGYYSLKLNKIPKKIMFYSIRYGLTEIDFPNKSKIDVTFKKMGVKEKIKYAELNKSEHKNNNRYRFKDIYSYLRGQVSGVRVLPDNTIIVQGISSLLGSNQPLFVLNKMAVNIDDIETINPNDIKSVKVLKGADASIWGVRGSAGVIVIKTY